jgi:hypothetical protein
MVIVRRMQGTLTKGTRVRLRAPSHLLELRSNTGTIVGPGRWADYYVVRLDRSAVYHDPDTGPEELWEVVEMDENMDPIPSNGS